jgi:hypothetical protein
MRTSATVSDVDCGGSSAPTPGRRRKSQARVRKKRCLIVGFLSTQKEAIRIRPMNQHMAARAILIARAGQVMKALRRVCGCSLAVPVTLQAQQAYLAAHKQTRIVRPVRKMTGQAPIRPQTDVFKNEGPLFIRVTTQAESIPAAESLYALRDVERGMLLMTVMTVHAPFGDFVVKGSGKLGPNLSMAFEAEAGRPSSQNVGIGRFLMWIVTIVAGDGFHPVLILVKAALSRSFLLMAGHTHLGSFPCRHFRGIEDVTLAARLNVLPARAVTHLAAFDRRNIVRTADGGEMSCSGKPGVILRVTGTTCLRSDKIFSSRRGSSLWFLNEP